MGKFTERVDYILKQESAESLARKLLDKSQVDDVLDMIRIKLSNLKAERDEIKDKITNFDQNNNIDLKQENEILNNINTEITYLDRNKSDLERIIRKIDFMINEGKELYIQKILNQDIKNISDKLMLGFFQNMNNMNSLVNSSSIQQPIKLGISY
ncbi:unnamed protein product [Brachionus calyciflorus]|uniref:Uncharacterized protein n=1 Tax=Brachionus calyciflorus TaxID=104777 RepID=A0A813Y032_9BILA|nr:unnamed protein product [Brachionus calyciflorus]